MVASVRSLTATHLTGRSQIRLSSSTFRAVGPCALRPPAQILGRPAIACMATLISFGKTLLDVEPSSLVRESSSVMSCVAQS